MHTICNWHLSKHGPKTDKRNFLTLWKLVPMPERDAFLWTAEEGNIFMGKLHWNTMCHDNLVPILEKIKPSTKKREKVLWKKSKEHLMNLDSIDYSNENILAGRTGGFITRKCKLDVWCRLADVMHSVNYVKSLTQI